MKLRIGLYLYKYFSMVFQWKWSYMRWEHSININPWSLWSHPIVACWLFEFDNVCDLSTLFFVGFINLLNARDSNTLFFVETFKLISILLDWEAFSPSLFYCYFKTELLFFKTELGVIGFKNLSIRIQPLCCFPFTVGIF